ncbi:MAG: hypothetical protein R6U96_06325 [Promethearchaeia archaeon]
MRDYINNIGLEEIIPKSFLKSRFQTLRSPNYMKYFTAKIAFVKDEIKSRYRGQINLDENIQYIKNFFEDYSLMKGTKPSNKYYEDIYFLAGGIGALFIEHIPGIDKVRQFFSKENQGGLYHKDISRYKRRSKSQQEFLRQSNLMKRFFLEEIDKIYDAAKSGTEYREKPVGLFDKRKLKRDITRFYFEQDLGILNIFVDKNHNPYDENNFPHLKYYKFVHESLDFYCHNMDEFSNLIYGEKHKINVKFRFASDMGLTLEGLLELRDKIRNLPLERAKGYIDLRGDSRIRLGEWKRKTLAGLDNMILHDPLWAHQQPNEKDTNKNSEDKEKLRNIAKQVVDFFQENV